MIIALIPIYLKCTQDKTVRGGNPPILLKVFQQYYIFLKIRVNVHKTENIPQNQLTAPPKKLVTVKEANHFTQYELLSRHKQSQRLLYKHLRDSLINE